MSKLLKPSVQVKCVRVNPSICMTCLGNLIPHTIRIARTLRVAHNLTAATM